MGAVTYFIGGILQPFIVYMVWALMLEVRYKKYPFWVYAVLATVAIQVPTIIRGFVDGVLYDLMNYGQLAVLIAFAIILFKDKLWIKVFVVIIYYVCVIIAEVVAFAVLGDSVVKVDVYGDSVEALIVHALAMVVSFSLLGLVVIAWNLFLKKRVVPKNIFLFLLFPIGQICMLDLWSKQLHQGEIQFQSQFNVFLGLFIGFIADAILFFIMFMQGEKEEMKHRLDETEKLMELERTHYQAIRDSQEEVARIRHDFNNQLTAALTMAESGEMAKSQEMLEELRERIKNSGAKKWCENSVINAVLMDKQHSCQQKGINFEAEITVPEEILVNQLHLCSIFSNLLDNAIRAASESGKENAFVNIKTSVKERYIYIKVENTSLQPKDKKPEKDHGYGLEIIKNIAGQYHGEYQGNWEEGVYSALVVLELKGK